MCALSLEARGAVLGLKRSLQDLRLSLLRARLSILSSSDRLNLLTELRTGQGPVDLTETER